MGILRVSEYLIRSRRPLLFADSASHAEIGPVVFQTRDFTSDQPQPDERVWDVQRNILLTKLSSLASAGSDLQYTVGIVGEKRRVAHCRASGRVGTRRSLFQDRKSIGNENQS